MKKLYLTIIFIISLVFLVACETLVGSKVMMDYCDKDGYGSLFAEYVANEISEKEFRKQTEQICPQLTIGRAFENDKPIKENKQITVKVRS